MRTQQKRPQYLAPLVAVTVLLVALCVVIAVAVAADALDRPFGFFSREPSELARQPWYTGFLFHVGVLFWFGGAAVCLFAGRVLAFAGRREPAAPLLLAGLLTAVLAFDDALRLHEGFLLDHGVPKVVTYGVYALAFCAWLYAYRRSLGDTPLWLLIAAGALLATSVTLDRAFENHQRHLFEDGAKFIGIVAWTTYFTWTSFRRVTESRDAAELDDEPEFGYARRFERSATRTAIGRADRA